MDRYKKLHKKVRLKDGRTGIITAMLERVFVKLDVPIVKMVGKKEHLLGVWAKESEVEVVE